MTDTDARTDTNYVLEPTLRALGDSEETPSSEIRARVANALTSTRCPDEDWSSRKFMELLWHDKRVVGELGLGEYDLTSALDDDQFRSNVARVIAAALPPEGRPRVKALQKTAEDLMKLAQRHSVRASGSGRGDRPVIQTWRLMTALFPHDLAGLQASGYLRNRSAAKPKQPPYEGMLLYPQAKAELKIDVRLEGFDIRARTINLSMGRKITDRNTGILVGAPVFTGTRAP